MKAVVMTDYGDVSRLELRELPEPKPGPDDVKVRLSATSINPVDYKIRRGALKSRMPVQLPYVLGRDASGEVVEVGARVQGFKPGDRVLGLAQHTYAEYVVAPANAWAPLPARLDPTEAAAYPLVSLTGAQLIEEGVQPKRGDLILVTGAVGNVGRVAVFVARGRGARVIPGVRRSQLADAKALCVEAPVDIDDPSAMDGLPPLDGLADTVGGEVGARVATRVKRGGSVGSVVGEPAGAKERGLTVRALLAHPDPKRLASLAQAAASRELVIPISRRFPLAQAREAQALAEQGGVGKVLLTVP